MGKDMKNRFQGVASTRAEDDEESFGSSESMSGESGGSAVSSLSDLTEDEVSSSSNGPLYELSSLMAQLPIKRGLSKIFDGKSQSFTSLAEARSIEDLAKKEIPYKRRMKTSKSYAGGLDASQRRCYAPYSKSTQKKPPRAGSCASSVIARNNSSGILCNGKSSYNLHVNKSP